MGASESMLQFFNGAYRISVLGDACSRPGRIELLDNYEYLFWG